MMFFLHHRGHGVSQSFFIFSLIVIQFFFVIQRSIATKDLVYIYVYTLHCVPEILRFALDDNK